MIGPGVMRVSSPRQPGTLATCEKTPYPVFPPNVESAALTPSETTLGELLMTKKEDNAAMLIRLWLERPEDKRRTTLHMLEFHAWIQLKRSYLLHGMQGDPWQTVAALIRPHLSEPQ